MKLLNSWHSRRHKNQKASVSDYILLNLNFYHTWHFRSIHFSSTNTIIGRIQSCWTWIQSVGLRAKEGCVFMKKRKRRMMIVIVWN